MIWEVNAGEAALDHELVFRWIDWHDSCLLIFSRCLEPRSAVARQVSGSLLQSISMNRRTFLQCGLGTAWVAPVIAAAQPQDKLDVAADVLTRAVAEGQVDAAVLYVRHKTACLPDRSGRPDRSMISSCWARSRSRSRATALMTLYDQGGSSSTIRSGSSSPSSPAGPGPNHGSAVAHACVGPPRPIAGESGAAQTPRPTLGLRCRGRPDPAPVRAGFPIRVLEHGDPAGRRSRPADQRDRVPRVRRRSRLPAAGDEAFRLGARAVPARSHDAVPGRGRRAGIRGGRPDGPRVGLEQSRTGAGSAHRGAACTPQPPTWHGSSPSSFIGRARRSGRRPHG